MAKIYNPPRFRTGTRISGALIGIAVSALLFLAIPLTQIFTDYKKAPEEINAIEVATPPPPPPPQEPPPPPEPEEEEPPPELENPPPPITLEQLDLALNPGTGGAMAGDFALPNFDLSGQDLGGMEIFDISDVDKQPIAIKQVEPRSRGQEGKVVLEFTVNSVGTVENVKVLESTNPRLIEPSVDAVRRWKFHPGEKDGRKINTRVRLPINFTF